MLEGDRLLQLNNLIDQGDYRIEA